MSLVDNFTDIKRRLDALEGDEPVCEVCNDGGWICHPHPTRGVPMFDLCHTCYNPKDLPCP